jgi:hypothetical protein
MKVTVKDNKMTISDITLLPEKEAELSSTGKSKVLFTSKGFKFDDDNMGTSVTVIKPLKLKAVV